MWWVFARHRWLDGDWPGAPDSLAERKDALVEYERPWLEANGVQAAEEAYDRCLALYNKAKDGGLTWEQMCEESQKKEGGNRSEKG